MKKAGWKNAQLDMTAPSSAKIATIEFPSMGQKVVNTVSGNFAAANPTLSSSRTPMRRELFDDRRKPVRISRAAFFLSIFVLAFVIATVIYLSSNMP